MASSRKSRVTPQIKVTIPDAERADVLEAMEWDGITNYSVFALAAIRQRVRRLKREKASELAAEEAAKSARR